MADTPERPKGTLTLNTATPETFSKKSNPYNPERLDLTTAEGVCTTLRNALEQSDFDYVANLLACTLPGLDMGERKMVTAVFSMPELQPHQELLWRKMKPDITPEFKVQIYDFLVRECEWEI